MRAFRNAADAIRQLHTDPRFLTFAAKLPRTVVLLHEPDVLVDLLRRHFRGRGEIMQIDDTRAELHIDTELNIRYMRLSTYMRVVYIVAID